MTEHLIVLAGGASSRMKKSSSSELSNDKIQEANSRSKALILFNDRPMLDYVLRNAKQAGFKNIYIVIGEEDVLFKKYYGKQIIGNIFHKLNISYVIQYIPIGRLKPFGTADAVFQALEQYSFLKQCQFVVCNCDNLYSVKAFELLKNNSNINAFINYDRDALIYPEERIERFALTKTDENNYLLNIIEKPSINLLNGFKDSNGKFRVSMNIFLFDGVLIYPFLKECEIHEDRNEKELPSAILKMIAFHPKSMKAVPLAEHVPDLTGKSDILAMREYIRTTKFCLD